MVGTHGDDRGHWLPLTEALNSTGSPLKTYLAERFPCTKPVFQRYKDEAGPVRVPASTTAIGGTGTVGGAFDYLVRFLVHPQPDVDLAALGAQRYGGRMLLALAELALMLRARPLAPSGLSREERWTTFTGPPWPSPDFGLLARGCWALALLAELARGVPPGRSPLAGLNPHTVGASDLLALAPPVGLDQLSALRDQAEAVLLPALASRCGRWTLGPTFEGSALMNADADLIAAGTLVEIKTVLGAKRKKDGTRYAVLDASMLFQMLGYVLLDFHDEFEIHELMLFNARYGYVATWNLQDLLNTLAGGTADLPALRAEFSTFLRAGALKQGPRKEV